MCALPSSQAYASPAKTCARYLRSGMAMTNASTLTLKAIRRNIRIEGLNGRIREILRDPAYSQSQRRGMKAVDGVSCRGRQ